MANEQMPQTYARIIFEQATQSWLLPLREFVKCAEPADVEALDRPGVPFSEKGKVLQRTIPSNAPAEVRNFLSLLASKNEVYLLPSILDAVERYSQHGSLRLLATVTSAVELREDERRSLEETMRSRFGEDLDFHYEVNPSILGGVIVRVGDKVIDGSVSGKLTALRDKLK